MTEPFVWPKNPYEAARRQEGTLDYIKCKYIDWGMSKLERAIETYLGCSIEEAKEIVMESKMAIESAAVRLRQISHSMRIKDD